MKTLKKFLCGLLAASSMLMPVVSAADAENMITDDNVIYLYQSGTHSDALVLNYDDDGYNYSLKGTVTIPSEIQNYKVTGIDYRGFWQCKNLENIVIPDTVEIIGEQAFFNCPNLRSATIPDSVKEIQNEAFAYCSSLQSVTIPDKIFPYQIQFPHRVQTGA